MDCQMGDSYIRCNIYFDPNIEINTDFSRNYVTFENSTNFSGRVNLPRVNRANYVFVNCWSLNAPIFVPNTINNMTSAFGGCNHFNARVTFEDGIVCNDYSGIFAGCTNLNRPIIFPDIITNNGSYFRAFSECLSFNQPVTFGNNVNHCYEMFRNCVMFNQPINIPDSVTNCSGMFHNCVTFNQPVKISNNAKECVNMFRYCRNFNQPINIPDSVTSLGSGFLSNCVNFNSDLHIGNRVTYAYALLDGYSLRSEGKSISDVVFNANVFIGNNVINCGKMFANLRYFNKPITIPESVIECGEMFNGCNNFNQPVTLPNYVNNCTRMFNGCTNFNQDLYVPDGTQGYYSIVYSLRNMNNFDRYNHTVSIPRAFYKNIMNEHDPANFYPNVNVPNPSYTGVNPDICTLGAKVIMRDIGVTAEVVEYTKANYPYENKIGYTWDIYLPYIDHE